jgi:membrane protein implicated in regulation of membrane protease activity
MNEVKTEKKEKKQGDSWDSVKGFAVWLGTYGWIFLLITGIIYIIGGLVLLTLAAIFVGYGIIGTSSLIETTLTGVIYLIGGILAIIFTVAFVKPRFSNKWKEEDYDYLLNDVVKIGKARIPLMLIIGIILEIFLSWWGGLIILVPLLLLIFMGPKEYKWTEEEKKPISN